MEDDLETLQIDPALGPSPAPVKDDTHLNSLNEFIRDVNVALDGALARNGSPYEKATVLFLRWEDDVFISPGINNGVQGEIDRLERVLVDDYGFDSETFLIPSKDPQRRLQQRISDFDRAHDQRSELVIVYYGGHGALSSPLKQSIWLQ